MIYLLAALATVATAALIVLVVVLMENNAAQRSYFEAEDKDKKEWAESARQGDERSLAGWKSVLSSAEEMNQTLKVMSGVSKEIAKNLKVRLSEKFPPPAPTVARMPLERMYNKSPIIPDPNDVDRKTNEKGWG